MFIIGSRGLPAQYGGFETFVDELVSHQQSDQIKYHVANLSKGASGKHSDYKTADVFDIKARHFGPANVIFYDRDAINYALSYIKENKIMNPIFYVLGNTLGAFIGHYAKKIHKIGGKLLVNPDGLEWKRSKWVKPIQMYLKFSEQKMAKIADLIISDNQGIEDYLKAEYGDVTSTVIAYGTNPAARDMVIDMTWFDAQEVKLKDYYLVVGRFVPENNYEAIIQNFMASDTTRDLVIITNHQGNPYFDKLREITGFEQDKRVKFVGTVYDKETLTAIRQQAFAYIHGHAVGGTNPGLLEAMGATDLNLVYDVSFNRNVALDSALFWQLDNLTALIAQAEKLETLEITRLAEQARAIIAEKYTWERIVAQYERLFLNES
ncbi:glycosyl transferase [Lactococcus raffinolactis]|nr:glycosyl transferase [Lactococcus raffinolactis]